MAPPVSMIWVDGARYARTNHPDHEKADLGGATGIPSRRSRNARITRATPRSQSNGLIRDGPIRRVWVRDLNGPGSGRTRPNRPTATARYARATHPDWPMGRSLR